MSKVLPTDCKENRKKTHLLYWPAKFLHGIAGANSRQQGFEKVAQPSSSLSILYSAVNYVLPCPLYSCKQSWKKRQHWHPLAINAFLHGIAQSGLCEPSRSHPQLPCPRQVSTFCCEIHRCLAPQHAGAWLPHRAAVRTTGGHCQDSSACAQRSAVANQSSGSEL